jgi:hypothetical protein
LERILVREGDGRERLATTYEYDSSEKKKETIYFGDERDKEWRVHCQPEGTNCGYTAPGAAKVVILHDVLERPGELVFYDINDSQLSKVNIVYDDAGLVVEESQLILPGTSPANVKPLEPLKAPALATSNAKLLERSHRYDARGRRVESKSFMFGQLFERKLVAYNEYDDPIEEVTWLSNDAHAFARDGHDANHGTQWALRFNYDYDMHANWVARTVETGELGMKGAAIVERRVVRYHV